MHVQKYYLNDSMGLIDEGNILRVVEKMGKDGKEKTNHLNIIGYHESGLGLNY